MPMPKRPKPSLRHRTPPRPSRSGKKNQSRISVAKVATAAGAEVKEGDLLLTIEAMKMETGLHADRDGVIKAVYVTAGAQIDAKDLLFEFE